MNTALPDLSRFEMECLRRVWSRGEASVRDVHESLDDPPSYSTVRKIFERLEEKGAVRRTERVDRAWRYASAVGKADMVRKEIGALLETLFDGSAKPLVSHLAEMDALDLDDLRALEARLTEQAEEADEEEM